MNRHEYQQHIIKSLSWLKNEVSLSNEMNFTDINVQSENFYRDLLNLVFSYNLININIIEKNAAAIDLGDENNGIAIQVTSTSTLGKTKHTVTKFIEKTLYKKYSRLVILNIVEKTNHKAPQIGDHNFKLDTKNDIWDVGTLTVKINDLPTQILEIICNYLNQELYTKPANTLPKEILTILGLIEYISDEEHPATGDGFLEQPFPEDKIYKRFSEHSSFLEQRYYDLYIEYGAVLSAIKDENDFGQVKLRKAARHLRGYSDKVLTESDDNPKLALEKIIEHFSNLLGNSGYEFDAGAAEFYIIEQLTQCNVFPNKEETNG